MSKHYKEGWDSAESGDKYKNPYCVGSRKHQEYEEGFYEYELAAEEGTEED